MKGLQTVSEMFQLSSVKLLLRCTSFFFFFWSSSQFKKLSLRLFKIATGILVTYYFCCCCCCSVAQLCLALCDPVDCNTPGFHVHHQPPEFSQAYVHWVGDAIQPSYPLLFPSPPAFNLSQHQGLFPGELALCIRWPKCWIFSFNISPSNEYSVLISFRVDWFDLLTVQVTLKSLFQHHSLKASIPQHSAFFIVQHLSFLLFAFYLDIWFYYYSLFYPFILLTGYFCG